MENVFQVDLECGVRRHSSGSDDDGSGCFSDADEGSCYSQFYSTHDGSYDDHSFACPSDHEIGGISDSASDSDCSVDVKNELMELKLPLEVEDRDCRICHLSLLEISTTNPVNEIAIELGCSCKDDLAAAHKHCAEAWFKIKGNRTCEICNSVARNVFTENEIQSTQPTNESNSTTTSAVAAPVSPPTETRTCLNGQRFLNFLLACMVFAFVISWLFHFNVPS